jgi:hypothetical protein
MQGQRPGGFDAVPHPQWGSHLCQIYGSGDDLRETLAPYFKAGLENNERCFWVTARPFGAEDARAALRAVVGDFDARERLGQIEILDAEAWYAAEAKLEPAALIEDLLRREREAPDRG